MTNEDRIRQMKTTMAAVAIVLSLIVGSYILNILALRLVGPIPNTTWHSFGNSVETQVQKNKSKLVVPSLLLCEIPTSPHQSIQRTTTTDARDRST